MHRLLVPLDIRSASLRAIGPARRLADRLGVDLDVVTWSLTEWDGGIARRRIERALRHVGLDLPVELITTSERNAGIALASAAAERDAIVVMASHARGGIGRTVLGSTAEEVLSHAVNPVVLVGPHVDVWEPTGRVVTCVDGSDVSETALAPAVEWAEQLGLPLHLVNVIEAGAPYPLAPDVLDGSYVTGLAGRLVDHHPTDFDVLHGDAAAAIVHHASTTDLVALSSHGRRGISRTVMGSIAMRVVHRSRCPVLVVGAAARAAQAGSTVAGATASG